MKSEISKLLSGFKEIYLGPNWIEVSLRDVLANVDSKLAFTPPPGGRNSMAQIICHLVYYRQYLIQKLQEDTTENINQNESFNPGPYGENPETAWQNLLGALQSSFREIEEILETMPADFLQKQALPHNYNFDYLISGIIQHEAYHTGQLELLKKQLQQLAPK